MILLGLALATSTAAVPTVTPAPLEIQRYNQRHNRNDWRKWRKGQRFDRRHARYYQQIDYRKYRGLRAPPRGYRWVRSDNDAVLVAIGSGIIASVIANAIR